VVGLCVYVCVCVYVWYVLCVSMYGYVVCGGGGNALCVHKCVWCEFSVAWLKKG